MSTPSSPWANYKPPYEAESVYSQVNVELEPLTSPDKREHASTGDSHGIDSTSIRAMESSKDGHFTGDHEIIDT